MTGAAPFYLDWTFWTAIVALLAIVLSQLPPIHLLLRAQRLEVEVHARIQVSHYSGNPQMGLVVTIRNRGGRELRVRNLRMELWRDGRPLGTLPIQVYFEGASSQAPVLFVPFSLKPDDNWSHGTQFWNLFERQTEKTLRESQSALNADIARKLAARPQDDARAVIAEPGLVAPFLDLFRRLFIWTPGEYIFALFVDSEPSSASYAKKYRFTLYESDTAELTKYVDDYKFGAGIYYQEQRHTGVFVPITEHIG